MPDEAPAVFNHVVRRTGVGRYVGIFGYDLIDELTAYGVHQRVELASAHHQPAFLRPLDGGQVVAGYLRVLRVPGDEFLGLGVEHLQAAAEGAEPDAVPLILRQGPDAVVGQTAGRSLIVHHRHLRGITARGDAVGHTAVIGAKPHGAVAGCPGAYHDVAGHRAVILRDAVHHLVGLGVIDDDTGIIAAHPVVAVLVFADGVDVAQFHTPQARQASHVLVETVLIGTNPDTAVARLVDVAERIVANRRLVVLVVLELLPLLALQVYHDQSLVVASQP